MDASTGGKYEIPVKISKHDSRLENLNKTISFTDFENQVTQNISNQAAMSLLNAQLLDQLRSELLNKIRTDIALRESEATLGLFVDHAPASLAMFDTNMRYIGVSKQWLMDDGLLGRDVIGRSQFEVVPDIAEGMETLLPARFEW